MIQAWPIFLVPLLWKTIRLSKTGRGLSQVTKNMGKVGTTGVAYLDINQGFPFLSSHLSSALLAKLEFYPGISLVEPVKLSDSGLHQPARDG